MELFNSLDRFRPRVSPRSRSGHARTSIPSTLLVPLSMSVYVCLATYAAPGRYFRRRICFRLRFWPSAVSSSSSVVLVMCTAGHSMVQGSTPLGSTPRTVLWETTKIRSGENLAEYFKHPDAGRRLLVSAPVGVSDLALALPLAL